MAGADDDDVTDPGPPLLLTGTPAARAVGDLAVSVQFYGRQLELIALELRRGGAAAEVPPVIRIRMLELLAHFERTCATLAPSPGSAG